MKVIMLILRCCKSSGLPRSSKFLTYFGVAISLLIIPAATVSGIGLPLFDATGPITRATAGSGGMNGSGISPSLSQEGRFVAFESYSPSLVPGDGNNSFDIFVRDMATGLITRASTDSGGAEANSWSTAASISANGRYVAFQSAASNLVGDDANGKWDVFVKDTLTGRTSRASTDAAGGEGGGVSSQPSISGDGSLVSFTSLASNLVPGDTNGVSDVFVKNLSTGSITRISTGSSGEQANYYNANSSISADGRFVSFDSDATNLVPGDTNGEDDIFLKDIVTGGITRVSTNSSGAESNGSSWAYNNPVSANGRYVAFASTATNLVPGDVNGSWDVFVKDVLTGKTTRASTDSLGIEARDGAFDPAISANGRYVAFASRSANLTPGNIRIVGRAQQCSDQIIENHQVCTSDLESEVYYLLGPEAIDPRYADRIITRSFGWISPVSDIYVKDLLTGRTVRLSTSKSGTPGDSDSYYPSLSAEGRFVAFSSFASNLVAGDEAGQDIFVKDTRP